jgi:hypothetical protein
MCCLHHGCQVTSTCCALPLAHSNFLETKLFNIWHKHLILATTVYVIQNLPFIGLYTDVAYDVNDTNKKPDTTNSTDI